MLQISLNITAFLIAGFATAFAFYLSRESRLLRKGLILISSGLFVAIGIHALAELLESSGYLDSDILIIIMPIFVSIGSILIVVGAKVILDNVTTPIKSITKALAETGSDIGKIKVPDQDNEITAMLNVITKFKKDLEKLNLELEEKVKEKTSELTKRNKELEETLEDFYTLRIGLAKDMESGKVVEENKKIKARLDQLEKEED